MNEINRSAKVDEKKMRLIRECGHYLSVPKGISMYPMLRSKENVVDIVPAKHPLKKYDVVLYYRESDHSCVLHRILGVADTHYTIYGDNCWQKEIVPYENVMGVAARFYKSGKWIDVTDKKYLLYVHLWCDFLPIRRGIFRLRDLSKRWRRRFGAKRNEK